MSGNLLQPAGSQLLSYFESIGRPPLFDGLLLKESSRSVREPELLLSAISKKRTIGGCPNI